MKATPSIWTADLPGPLAPFPGGTQRADVAVIGGGMAGLSTALHLLERSPGLRVVVLEADRVGAGASGRTTGMLGPGVGQSLTSLVGRFGQERARALYGATLRAVEEVSQLIRREHIACELELSGQVVVARSDRARQRLAAQAALLEGFGFPVSRLDDEALEQLVRLRLPRSRPERGPAALKLPVAGTLNPGLLLRELSAKVTARGGAIFERARVSSVGQGRPVRLPIEGGGEVVADQVAVTTAGYTPGLGLFRGRILPLRLQVLVTQPLDGASRQALGWKGREGMLDARRVFNYFRLTADDRIVFGGGAPRYVWGGRLDGDAGDGAALDLLTRELSATFPEEVRLEAAGGWTGIIGYVLDALPAIHRLEANPAVCHAVGWCGHGVALSLAAGRWMTHLLLDGAAAEDLPWYRANPPLIPFEPVRWLTFQAAMGAMRALDQLEEPGPTPRASSAAPTGPRPAAAPGSR